MTKWIVTVPITGYVTVTVEAEDEEEAIEKAMECDVSTDDIEQWDMTDHIVQGNVFYGIQNEAEAEKVDD